MGKTILVADDSDTIRKAVQMTFRATEFDVVAARSGDDALGQLDSVRPDVVLADCAMDGIDGYTVCARIKDAGHPIAVILMGSTSQPIDQQRADMARANTTVDKPFDTKTLIHVVRQLTGSEAAAPEQPLTFADALARRNQPEPEPAFAHAHHAHPVASADIIIDDEPEIIDEVDGGGSLPAGPTLEPPAPPDGLRAARPPVDVWSLTEDANAAQAQRGIDEVQIEEEPTATVLSAADVGASAPRLVDDPPSLIPPPRLPPPRPPEPVNEAVTDNLERTGNGQDLLSRIPENELRTMVREAIEKVVWEVVPELAETIIREELRRLTADDGGS